MLRIEQVLQMYKISKPTLYVWIETGLNVYKVGNIPFFEEQEIIDFIKSHKSKGE